MSSASSSPPEIPECQPPSQRSHGQGNQVCINRAILFLCGHRVEELNEVQDLLARTFGILKSKESKSRCEVSKALLDVLHEAGHFEIVYSKVLEVCECGKVT